MKWWYRKACPKDSKTVVHIVFIRDITSCSQNNDVFRSGIEKQFCPSRWLLTLVCLLSMGAHRKVQMVQVSPHLYLCFLCLDEWKGYLPLLTTYGTFGTWWLGLYTDKALKFSSLILKSSLEAMYLYLKLTKNKWNNFIRNIPQSYHNTRSFCYKN